MAQILQIQRNKKIMAHQGLTAAEAHKRLAIYGRNEIIHGKKISGLADFLVRFKNPLVLILLFAAVLTGYFGDKISAFIIIVIVVASVILDFVNTYRSQKAVEELRSKVMITATVLRDGKAQELSPALIVPGDLILLRPGDIVPADGKILESKDFFINEASLTGESFPQEKATDSPVYMGSSAVTGDGTMQVEMTGKKTKYSHLAETLLQHNVETEFDRGVKDFSFLIMKLTFGLVIFIFLVNTLIKHSVLESFLFAAALAVGLTPELLPMIIALNLSKGSLAMSRRGVIVKKLSAIQNFGSMDVLCTDKTGTLTEDQITLVRHIDGLGRDSERVFFYAYLNSSYSTAYQNPLDEAVKAFQKLDLAHYQKIDEIPFDYERKRNSIVYEEKNRHILITKGAPEEILKVSNRYGESQESLTPALLKKIETEYQSLSNDGFRVLGLATRELRSKKAIYTKDEEMDLCFQGFAAFLDPPKTTVAKTLKLLEARGVEIKILTGDNELVTQKIAREISLPLKGVLLGEETEKLRDEQLRHRAENTTIFARVNPDQKKRIIQSLQKAGHVVGYLGDGINDAPSLKIADVSISVNNAVDVAKDTADLILMHKSLHDLIEGVVEGRRTFANTLKYLMMELSSNFGNMFSMAGASLFLPFLPMLPTQILFNNLVYDTSQFAIPTDNVDEEYVTKPRKFNIGFIRKFMLVFGPVSSVFDFLTFFVLFALFHFQGATFQTGWFLESIATQSLVIYIIRTDRVPFLKSRASKILTMSVAAAVIVGWGIIYTPFAKFLGFQALLPLPLLAIAGVVVLYLFVVELTKWWFYKKLLLRGS